MSQNPAISIASAIQSASVKRDPSPHHDINPSTAASTKIPIDIKSPTSSAHSDDASISSDVVDEANVIKPQPRRPTFPPLPDFRFEQSYLSSIKNADTAWKVAYITIKDQILFPLVQGFGYSLLLSGWRYWNRGTQFRGRTLGAKIRRWWWEVNKWEVPKDKSIQKQGSAGNVKEFYVDQFGSGMPD